MITAEEVSGADASFAVLRNRALHEPGNAAQRVLHTAVNGPACRSGMVAAAPIRRRFTTLASNGLQVSPTPRKADQTTRNV